MICNLIEDLVLYGISRGMVAEDDRVYIRNRLMEKLAVSDFAPTAHTRCESLEEILAGICDHAAEAGLIAEDTVTYRDLFDTSVMGLLMPRPSEVNKRFFELYAESPEKATDYFYKLSCDSDYIRRYRIKKDMKWQVSSAYGDIDITVNLSKPEKDPKAIAAAKLLPQSDFPKCFLCHDNEGFAGDTRKPARQTLRQVPICMAGEAWYFQYSPYVYYNEHCIALSAVHTPMKIDRSTFVKILDFVELFPHYFLGSNADLPIVGGSILSHDHMQGGHYEFAMERAPIEKTLTFEGFPEVEAGLVKWPMSVIRLSADKKEPLVALADKILAAWRGYTDADSFIFAETEGEKHNTITPIARRRGTRFELDLVLRNNITTKEHPLGVYHPHAALHNIKKENIGLIEVMGLAVLPSRLKAELALLEETILTGVEIASVPEIEKHATWFAAFKDRYTFTAENTADILKEEVGKTFVKVLEDAGVYKRTEAGREAFLRFIRSIG